MVHSKRKKMKKYEKKKRKRRCKMNAERLFLHVIDSDETLTGEQRQQMHIMMLRLRVYPHLEKMLEKQSVAASKAVEDRCHVKVYS